MVFISRGSATAPRWRALRAAHPDGRITTLCGEAIDYAPALIATAVSVEHVCPTCRDDLEAFKTPDWYST
jgi:hypothetical protein